MSWPSVSLVKAYYYLTKPGIIRGNILAAVAGFLLAAQGDIDVSKLLGLIAGLSLVIASACVCNNYLDRALDKHMSRTQKRAIPMGVISGRSAMLYAFILGIAGVLTLYISTTIIATAWAIFGFVAYVIIYGVAKRATVHGTLIGSISGSTPPVIGYTAVTGHFDIAAGLLFLIMTCWQMPHFFSIAMFRLDDYRAAKLPVLPVIGGARSTKYQTIVYTSAFLIASLSLYQLGFTSLFYAITVGIVGLAWLFQTWQGLKSDTPKSDIAWARQTFRYSLVVLSCYSLALAVDSFIH